MKISELNGFEAHLPTSGGKAGKGRAKTGTIQVRQDSMIVKQFRFDWAEKNSRIKAIRAAKNYMKTTITPIADAVKPIKPALDDTPGVFEIMAEWRSHEIQHWLDTTTAAHARALFETGAKLESLAENARLMAILKGLVENADMCFDDLKQLGAISRPNAVDYRRYRDQARAALKTTTTQRQ